LIPKIPGFQIPQFHDSRIPGFQGSRIPGFHDSTIPESRAEWPHFILYMYYIPIKTYNYIIK